MILMFIVNGEDVPVEVNPNQPLHVARSKALAQSHNTGRPHDEWEVRDITGSLIVDLSRPIESYGFGPDTRLFLTLRVGAGGGIAN